MSKIATRPRKEAPPLNIMTGNQMVELQELHCAGCGRFLGKQAIVWGIVQIKCKCGQWNTIDITPDNIDNLSVE